MYGLVITQLSILHCGNKPSHQISLPPWVTYKNPHGTISNTDLGLAGHVTHNNVHASMANIEITTMASYMDNTPALYWTKKGSMSTSMPAAYLLQLQALHQWHYCYHSRTANIAGTANVMADYCSRPWHLMDEQLWHPSLMSFALMHQCRPQVYLPLFLYISRYTGQSRDKNYCHRLVIRVMSTSCLHTAGVQCLYCMLCLKRMVCNVCTICYVWNEWCAMFVLHVMLEMNGVQCL